VKELPDFNELMRLAQENPDELERIRQEAVEDLITNAPSDHQRRLRGLQFQVDMERKRAKNPMDSCIRISRLMHDSFAKLRDTLNEAQQTHVTQLREILDHKNSGTTLAKRAQPEQQTASAPEEQRSAQVVQFPGH